MIGESIGQYRIEAEIGRGGMGVVYKAQDMRLDRTVAIKFLPDSSLAGPEARERFQQEARAAAALNHPNIATIHNIEEWQGRLYIVMEYVDGAELGDRIQSAREGSPIPVADAIRLGREIAAGLAAAHASDIIHRDIKPANIMIAADGRIRIMDFGLAKMIAQKPGGQHPKSEEGGAGPPKRPQLTNPGTTLGTAAYMSPEQVRADETDQRTDVWSLGVVLYEMLTGTLPFEGEYEQALLYAVLNEDPERPSALNPEVPAWLDRVVLRCLAKTPEARYENAQTLLADLDPSASSARASRSEEVEHNPGSSIWRYGLGAAGALLLLVLAILALKDRVQDAGRSGSDASESVAVLPFQNFSPDSADALFADGMTDELISKLSSIENLHVIARTSVMPYRGQNKSAASIGAELGVVHLVEGSLRKIRNTLRVRVNLLEAASQRTIWSSTYNRTFDEFFSIQEEIATVIAGSLRVELLGEDGTPLQKRPTDNLEAFNLYLQGRHQWNKRSEAAVRSGISFFEKAIALDSTYALAYAGLADSYIILSFWGYARPHEVIPEAKLAARKALRLDPELAEALTSLAFIATVYDWDWPAAEAGFRRAIALKPGYSVAHQWFSELLVIQDRFDEALAEIDEAIALDPLSPIISSVKGEWYRFLGETEKAKPLYDKVLNLNPDFAISLLHRSGYYMDRAEYDLARADIERALELTGGNSLFQLWLAVCHALAGDRERATEIYGAALTAESGAQIEHIWKAVAHVALGELDVAMSEFEASAAKRENNLWLIWRSGALEPIEDRPEFNRLLRQAGLSPRTPRAKKE